MSAVIKNTDTKEMWLFVKLHTSTMKTPTNKNVPIGAENRFTMNEATVTAVDASAWIVLTPHRIDVADNAPTFEVTGVTVEGLTLLGDLWAEAKDLLEKPGLWWYTTRRG